MLNFSQLSNFRLSGAHSGANTQLPTSSATAAINDPLNRVFQLAYFILQDKALAKRVTVEGLNKLDAVIAVQNKRRYYSPTGYFQSGKPADQKVRARVSMSELQLIQRLVYAESEPFEIN